MEVRVSCTLAIAIGIFSACWVPAITIMIASMIGKPLTRPDGPLDLCLRTLALSNSAMNLIDLLCYNPGLQRGIRWYLSKVAPLVELRSFCYLFQEIKNSLKSQLILMFNFCEKKLSSKRVCSYREGSLDFVQPNLNLLASVQDQDFLWRIRK